MTGSGTLRRPAVIVPGRKMLWAEPFLRFVPLGILGGF